MYAIIPAYGYRTDMIRCYVHMYIYIQILINVNHRFRNLFKTGVAMKNYLYRENYNPVKQQIKLGGQ